MMPRGRPLGGGQAALVAHVTLQDVVEDPEVEKLHDLSADRRICRSLVGVVQLLQLLL
jgi:hypothetical protein